MGRRKQEDNADSNGIVVLYTSLMILLLAFFILLNSMGKVEEAKVKSAYQSLMGTFGFKPGGMSAFQAASNRDTTGAAAPVSPVDQDYLTLRGVAETESLEDQVRFLRSDTSRTVVMPTGLLFWPDSMELSDQGKAFLDQVASVIKARQYPVTLLGHTDDAPPQRADGADEWEISGQRALAVLRYLAEHGVDPKRLAAFGMGGHSPLVANDSIAHRRQNNRVELVFTAQDPSRHSLPAASKPEVGFRGFSFDLLETGPTTTRPKQKAGQ